MYSCLKGLSFRKLHTDTMRPHEWMRNTSRNRFEGTVQPNEWTYGRARYESKESIVLREKTVSVSLPINVEKRIPESPVSSEFEDITDILGGNRSKLTLKYERSTKNIISDFNVISIIFNASML
ncbi:hypothetical protein ACFW04_008194 [Cataglyphis niger]